MELHVSHVFLGNDDENEGRANVSRSASAVASTFLIVTKKDQP
jgi:hypothetical protein